MASSMHFCQNEETSTVLKYHKQTHGIVIGESQQANRGWETHKGCGLPSCWLLQGLLDHLKISSASVLLEYLKVWVLLSYDFFNAKIKILQGKTGARFGDWRCLQLGGGLLHSMTKGHDHEIVRALQTHEGCTMDNWNWILYGHRPSECSGKTYMTSSRQNAISLPSYAGGPSYTISYYKSRGKQHEGLF